MGIPGLARQIIKNNKSHLWDKNMKFHYLFFDFNPIIYDCVYELESTKSWNFNKKTENSKFEKELVNNIFEKTKHIVNDIIKPIKLLYIAIDGPPPFAKMKQQRLRRYKPLYTDKFYNKYYPNEYIKSIKWDKSQISPGTIFMYNLNEKFKKEIKKNVFGNINVVFNGADIAGEGEHKFLPLLNQIEINKDENYCVYSKDADQIIILLPYTNRNMYILKPLSDASSIENNYPDEQEYFLLDINYVAKKFEKESLFNVNFNSKPKYYKKGGSKNSVFNENFLYDFVFLSFLEGNDFVMPIFFLKFREDYMKTVINYYKIIKNNLNQDLIIKKDSKLLVNHKFILDLFEKISKMEESKLNEKNIRVQTLISKYTKNPKFVQKCEMDYESVEHKLFYCPNNPLYKEFIGDWNKIFLKDGKFCKSEYYKYFFGDSFDMDALCYDYVKVLIFNLNYYFGIGKNIYWRYQYTAPISPLPSDFYKYLLDNPKIFENVKFEEKAGPYNPYVQLAYILPPDAQFSIPKVFKDKYLNKKSNMFKDFSENLKLEMITGDKLVYAEIDLPNISINELEKYYNEVKNKFTPLEKKIGELNTEPLIHLPKENKNKMNLLLNSKKNNRKIVVNNNK